MPLDSNSELVSWLEENIHLALERSQSYEKFRSEINVLYQPVPKAANFANEVRVKGCRKKNQLLTLSVLSWYFDPILGTLVRMWLQETIKQKRGLEDLLLTTFSRKDCLIFLFTSTRTNFRYLKDVFKLENLEKFLERILIFPVFNHYPRPKRLLRHKGYRDKGSLPEISQVAIRQGYAEEFRLKQQQFQKEEYEKNIEDFILLNKSWMDSMGFLLSDDYYFDSKKGIIYYDLQGIIEQQDFKERGEPKKVKRKTSESGENNCFLRAKVGEPEAFTQKPKRRLSY
jgi:hypothetical protein